MKGERIDPSVREGIVRLLPQYMDSSDLAKIAGLPHSTLSRIRSGHVVDPGVFTVKKIANALGATVSELIGEISEETNIQKQTRKDLPVIDNPVVFASAIPCEGMNYQMLAPLRGDLHIQWFLNIKMERLKLAVPT